MTWTATITDEMLARNAQRAAAGYDIPRKECECGCGRPAPIAKVTDHTRGWVKGMPIRFIHGHHGRLLSGYTEEDRGYKTNCWIWSNGSDENYGKVSVDGRDRPAHRVMYEEQVGPIPSGLEIDHLCRVRRCVNPEHLEPVTAKENVRRAMSLSRDDCEFVKMEMARSPRPPGLPRSLAMKYGVSVKTIQNIAAGRSYWE